MSQYDFDKTRRDALAGKPAPDTKGMGWKEKQDTLSGHADGTKSKK